MNDTSLFHITSEYSDGNRVQLARLGYTQETIDYCIDANPFEFNDCQFEYAE